MFFFITIGESTNLLQFLITIIDCIMDRLLGFYEKIAPELP